MTDLSEALQRILPFVPSAVAVAIIVIGLFVIRGFLERRREAGHGQKLQHQLMMISLTFVSVLAILVVLPLGDSTRGQLLSLIGILLSAAIALSSTTFIGNAMAGVMLRAVRNFRTGDFVRVGDHFGRVSERGLFHTEIQTEDRDLTTLPNMFLVTNPVTTMRSSGTVLSATVSLGYDVPQAKIEQNLLKAAERAGLTDPFVQIMDLGDFSVTYRVAGLLTQVKRVLSARSQLRGMMMQCLHEGGIEIVSPTFMNTRVWETEQQFIPTDVSASSQVRRSHVTSAAENMAFDKADKAESVEMMTERSKALATQLEELKTKLDDCETDEEKASTSAKIERLEAGLERLNEAIQKHTPSD